MNLEQLIFTWKGQQLVLALFTGNKIVNGLMKSGGKCNLNTKTYFSFASISRIVKAGRNTFYKYEYVDHGTGKLYTIQTGFCK